MSCQEIAYPYLAATGHHKYVADVEGAGPCGTLRVTSSPPDVPIGVSPVDDFARGDGITEFCREYLLQIPVTVALVAPLAWNEKIFVLWMLDGVSQPPGIPSLIVEMDGECHHAHALYTTSGDPPFPGACCPDPDTDPPPWICYMTTGDICEEAGDIWYGPETTCQDVDCGLGTLNDCCGLPWPLNATITANWEITANAPPAVHCCACHECTGNCAGYFPCPDGWQNDIEFCRGQIPIPCVGAACGNHIQTTGTCCHILAAHRSLAVSLMPGGCAVTSYTGDRCLHPNPLGCQCAELCPTPLDCFIPEQHDDGAVGCTGGICCNRPFLSVWTQRVFGSVQIFCRCTEETLRLWGYVSLSVHGCLAGIHPGNPYPCRHQYDPTQDPLGWFGPPTVTLTGPFDIEVQRGDPPARCADLLADIFPLTTDVAEGVGPICTASGTLTLSL